MQEMQVQSLGWEDPLEMERATHSSILIWEIPWTWTEKLGELLFMELQRVGHSWATERALMRALVTAISVWFLFLIQTEGREPARPFFLHRKWFIKLKWRMATRSPCRGPTVEPTLRANGGILKHSSFSALLAPCLP